MIKWDLSNLPDNHGNEDGPCQAILEDGFPYDLFVLNNPILCRLLSLLPSAVILFDARDNAICCMNERAKELFGKDWSGFSPDRQRKEAAFLTPDGSELQYDDIPYCRSLRYGETIRSRELLLVSANGRRKCLMSASPVFINGGAVAGAIAVFEEIDSRGEAQREPADSRENERWFAQNAPVGICEVDFRCRRFISANDMLCGMTGYSRDELLGMDPLDIIDGASRAAFADTLGSLLSEEGEYANADCVIIAKDGRRICTALITRFTADETGKLARATVIVHDITGRKRMEDILQKSRERALSLVRKLQKTNSNKNRFLHTLSHELRNPLATITLSLSLLGPLLPETEQARKVYGILEHQTGHLSKLVDDLMDIARINQNRVMLRKERIEIIGLISRAVDDYRAQSDEKGIRLTMTGTKSAFVEADPTRMTQIIHNLLNNAFKYTQPGGGITIRTETDAAANQLTVQVEDTGEGIQPDLLDILFEPFTQGNPTPGGGLGLGLSVVKGLAELHGGTVSAFSKGPGMGACFTLKLPALPETDPLYREAE